jgi:hypothetical protein
MVTRVLVGDELLQLPDRFADRDLEPGAIRLRDSHTRELTHGGPGEPARFERANQMGQRFQGFGDAQLLLRGARGIPKQPLDVLAEAAKTQVHMGRRAHRAQ